MKKLVWLPVVFVLALMAGTIIRILRRPATVVRVRRSPPPVEWRTCFQTIHKYSSRLDLQTDVVMVYGHDETMTNRAASWGEHGYDVHFMTGASWGNYGDYWRGAVGKEPLPYLCQMLADDRVMRHDQGSPYLVPTADYTQYLQGIVRQAIDAGMLTIHLEEPEYWAAAGYSIAFRQGWRRFHKTRYRPPRASPDAAYKAARVKQHLFRELVDAVGTTVRARGRRSGQGVGRDTHVRLSVPVHSILNYAAWGIVSPGSGLTGPSDMIIGQVWTDTAAVPMVYEGGKGSHVFETAWLEYASLAAMVQPTRCELAFLVDPSADVRGYSWRSCRAGYESTVAAMLMHGSVDKFEVMPWPSRVLLGRREVEGQYEPQPIPGDYATEIMVVCNALAAMDATTNAVSGLSGIGVMQSDSIMCHVDVGGWLLPDRLVQNTFGLMMPLVKRGIPVKLVQMEHLGNAGLLDGLDVLLMSYAHMKPDDEAYHRCIADWVEAGGVLVYVGTDNDGWQAIESWWNSAGMEFDTPSAHLFALLGVKPAPREDSTHAVGRGHVIVVREDPHAFMVRPGWSHALAETVEDSLALSSRGGDWMMRNYFMLERNGYVIVAVLKNSVSMKPYAIEGPVLDLFDPKLPVLEQKTVRPGSVSLVYRITDEERCRVVAASSRARDEFVSEESYSFTMRGPRNVPGVARIALPREPVSVSALSEDETDVEVVTEWHAGSGTLLAKYPNTRGGVRFTIEFPATPP